MGLQPLEFADCLTDSPLFRTKLTEHERELERTSKAIKTLIQHGKQVFEAAKRKFVCNKHIFFNTSVTGHQLTYTEFITSTVVGSD